ncbi:hypothetical protein B0H63DRAFT_527124 [Podospora didyma]|uniref:4-coumarate--CoA ligase n=1 Tax=Podospora didyma TaxID=330526 RepID=A0AAE0KA08_9PEZI|nr:hypothetical protein B0H63DRAFT_527124 [Podospora didyma]
MSAAITGNGRQAYASGGSGHVPLNNAFDFHFSQPFIAETTYTKKSQVLTRIEDDRPVLVDNKSDRALTYGRIREDARAVASGLLELGLDPNDIHKLPPTATCPKGPEIAPVVLLQLPNVLPFAPILFGVLAAGLTATLASPALTSDEMAWILQNARPHVIITTTAGLPTMREALKKQTTTAFFQKVPVFIVDATEDTYPNAWSPPASVGNEKSWRQLFAKPSPLPVFPASAAAERTGVILWSSGTSGRSKGVLLSHHTLNVVSTSLWHDADYYLGNPQRWLGYVPFYHVFGLSNVFFIAVATGSTVYTMPSFNLDAMLAAIPARKITYLHMAPPVVVMLAKSPKVEPYVTKDPKTGKNGFSSVVAAVTGGAPCGHDVVVHAYERCGFRVRLGYGLSETGSTALQRGITEKEMREQAGDTGAPHRAVELMIADPTTGKPVATDEEGEVLVRGPMIMAAYLPIGFMASSGKGEKVDMSATTEALTPEGWFRTGDVGALCKDGRLRITDRLKELIKVRAYQVAPAELEAVLCSSDSVADAGVVGVYDKDEATEWPRAYVVPAVDVTDLQKLALELKGLVEARTTKYKWLVGGVVFVKAIPKSPSGKILRRVLKSGGEETKGLEVMLYQKKVRHAKL